MTRIAIIGGGNLGAAIARGLVRSGKYTHRDLILTRRHLAKIADLNREGFSTSNDNIAACREAGVILLCVQPKQLADVIAEIKDHLQEGRHILVSTITGVTTEEIQALTGKEVSIVRAMPNTAIAIGRSMTCLCTSNASEEALTRIEELFAHLGKTLIIEERLMKAATVLAASGIAFFMRYMRAATQGGIQLGFDAGEAQLIAGQTALGAASLLLQNNTHPEVEIDKVTTPEGCTIAGLNEMEHQGLSSALIKGILCSFEKINRIRN